MCVYAVVCFFVTHLLVYFLVIMYHLAFVCFLALFVIHHLFHSYSVDLVKTQQHVITITNYSALRFFDNKNNNDEINVKDE